MDFELNNIDDRVNLPMKEKKVELKVILTILRYNSNVRYTFLLADFEHEGKFDLRNYVLRIF